MSIERPNYENSQILPLKGEVSPESMPEYIKQQFDNPEKLEMYGRDLEIVDISPEEKDIKSKVPVVYSMGWGVTKESHRGTMLGLAEDRRVLAVDAPHGFDSKDVPPEEKIEAEDIPQIQLAKVTALLKAMEAKGLKKTDVVAHSEGAIVAIFAATLRPDLFRNMVLVNPAGMIGEDTKWKLMGRATLDIALQIKRIWDRAEGSLLERTAQTGKKMLMPSIDLNKVIASSPMKTWRSIGEISGAQVHELIGGLKDLGIKISIIHGVDDKFFPMEKVQKNILAESVAGVYSVTEGHDAIRHNPERYAKLSRVALDDLQKLREKEEAEAVQQ